jgi:non-ribosomal peptide synthetase component F
VKRSAPSQFQEEVVGRTYRTAKGVHQLFEEQAVPTPDAVALVYEDQQLTYSQLSEKAQCLASYLRSLGVGPEVPVALCAVRSLEMIIGLLGILKTGGFYVPLDPTYPAERLTFILQDTGAAILVTQRSLAAIERADLVHRVYLDDFLSYMSNEQSTLPDVELSNQAYVMYTSGSTGTPKGVGVTHHGIVRLVQNVTYVDINRNEILLQFASISFDASTFEIWGSLLNGARLVIFPALMPSLEELGRCIQRYGVTTLWLTAGLFHQMVEHAIDYLSALHQLLAGGDVLSAPHVQIALQKLPGCTFINGYGPTECTTFSCCYAMHHINDAHDLNACRECLRNSSTIEGNVDGR